MPPSVYTVTIRDGIHKLLQKTSVLLQKTTGQMLINVKVRTSWNIKGREMRPFQMLINVKVRTYNEPRVPRIRAALKLGKTQH